MEIAKGADMYVNPPVFENQAERKATANLYSLLGI